MSEGLQKDQGQLPGGGGDALNKLTVYYTVTVHCTTVYRLCTEIHLENNVRLTCNMCTCATQLYGKPASWINIERLRIFWSIFDKSSPIEDKCSHIQNKFRVIDQLFP